MRAAILAAVLAVAVIGRAHATCDTLHPQRCDPRQMRVVRIDIPGSDRSFANAVNAGGQVAGYFTVGGYPHAFLYSAGSATALPEPADANGSTAQAIDAHGWCVGEVYVAGVGHAALWRAGKVYDLGPGSAIAINDKGVILGSRNNGAPTLWTNLVPQPVPGTSNQDSVIALNNLGELVGVKSTGGAYIFANPGGTTGLIAPGNFQAVNNRGEAVGGYAKSVLRYSGGVVSYQRAGPGEAEGVAVNDVGMIVGNADSGAFLMEPSGRWFNLTALYGFGLGAAASPFFLGAGASPINRSGWIAGDVMVGGVQVAALLVWQ
jgi:probable HAF family extracellular repeat protein